MSLPRTSRELAAPASPRLRSTRPERGIRSEALRCLLAGAAGGVSARELLSLLLEPGLGPTRAREGAARLLDDFPGSPAWGPLRRLGRAAPSQIATIGGITLAAAGRLVAALELGRRFAAEPARERWRVRGPWDVYERFHARLRDLPHEEFWVLVMDPQQGVLRETMVARGSTTGVAISPADVFRPAIQEGGVAIIAVHNHPSGEPAPSAADREVTEQLATAAEALGFELWDHVIIGEGRYASFCESGLLAIPGVKPPPEEGAP